MATDVYMGDVDQDELKKRQQQQAPPQPIGKPIAPAPTSLAAATAPAPTPPASVGTPIAPTTPPPMNTSTMTQSPQEIPTGIGSPSIGPPIIPPAGPGPTPPLTPRPEYHGFKRFLDTLGGATKIGSSIEAASGMGTEGWRQKNADEERQLAEGQKATQAAATAGNTNADAVLRQAQAKEAEARAHSIGTNATLTLPNGQVVSVPESAYGGDIRALIAAQEAGQRTTETNTSREKIANIEAENKLAVAGGKPPAHQIVMQGGKPMIMGWNPATKQYDQPEGEAPPNYAEIAPSLRTVDIISPSTGLPTQTTLAGKEIGVSGAGGYGHEMAQAGAVERAGGNLINDLRDPSNREVLGNLESYLRLGTLGTPIADAKAARIAAKLHSFSYLNPAMHAFRAKSAGDAFDKIVGGLAQDPDATIGAIQGIMQTAGSINPNVHLGGGGDGPAVGSVEQGYKFKGGNPNDKNNWEKVNAPTR